MVLSYALSVLPTLQQTSLLKWCHDMCAANGVEALCPGSQLLVYWYDMEHNQDKIHTRGQTWWPIAYVSKYAKYGVWFSARVIKYDPKLATLEVSWAVELCTFAAVIVLI